MVEPLLRSQQRGKERERGWLSSSLETKWLSTLDHSHPSLQSTKTEFEVLAGMDAVHSQPTCNLNPKTLMLNKDLNFKSGIAKTRKKGFERENKTENQKRERIDENKKLQFNIFMLFFHETKAKKKEK